MITGRIFIFSYFILVLINGVYGLLAARYALVNTHTSAVNLAEYSITSWPTSYGKGKLYWKYVKSNEYDGPWATLRKSNLRIFGVPDMKDETPDQTRQLVANLPVSTIADVFYNFGVVLLLDKGPLKTDKDIW